MVVYYKEYVDYLNAFRGLPGWFAILQLAEIEQQQADVELSIACVRYDVVTMASGVNPLLALALDQRTVNGPFQ